MRCVSEWAENVALSHTRSSKNLIFWRYALMWYEIYPSTLDGVLNHNGDFRLKKQIIKPIAEESKPTQKWTEYEAIGVNTTRTNTPVSFW